ncbi:MAG TPA: penicillin acylase family protein [Gemmatimonadaceae bacterium]|nr:penicillin acylase family protein [Gemmatimonadaceae bacterium]
MRLDPRTAAPARRTLRVRPRLASEPLARSRSRRPSRWRAALAPALLPVFAAVLVSCKSPASTASSATEILWDTWGVPHIYAASDPEAFRGFGYAQMTSHGNLILKLYGEARGRAAEYWGEPNLRSDRFVRTMGIPTRAGDWYRRLSPAMRANLDAFADGVNRYAKDHPEAIADSLKVVLPVTSQDVVAHGQKIINFLFMFFGQVQLPETMKNDVRPGSNMWAVSAQRSASGKPMLLGNPHLMWNDLYLFYEANVVTPDRNFYGVTLVGMPTPAIGFNDHVGWSHTVNTQDGADVYTLVPKGSGYLLDGAEKAYTTRTELLTVKLASGTRTDTLVVKESAHGPVFREDSTGTFAVRVAGLEDPAAVEQWWAMGGAKSMAEFEDIVKRLHVPFFNIMAASGDGHTYYFFGGKTPRRPRGDFGSWSAPVPGDSSALIWTEYLSYDELPHVMDPPSGWLQNANDPPWTATWPLVFRPDSFAPYVAPRGMPFRPQRSALMQLADSSITFDELVQYKHSTRMALADRVLPELVAAARAGGDADARKAADVLDRWDRSANADSRGAVLFQAWATEWFKGANGKPFAHAWRLDSALTTPSGLADARAAVKALGAAARATVKEHRALDVPYGDVNRLRYAGKDLPGNGGPGDPFGIFRVAYFAPQKDGTASIVAGDTYYQVVEFSDPVRAKVLTAYGNATQPGSKHVGDQLELFARQEMRDAWRTRADVEAHLESRVTLR